MVETLSEQADAVARAISEVVARRPGRLVAVTVTCPATLRVEHVVPMIQAQLVDLGLDFVDIDTRQQPGPIRVLGLEFER